jgi:micrococcal nuclease
MKYRVVLMMLLACVIEPGLTYAQIDTSIAGYGTVTRVSDGDTLWLMPGVSGVTGSSTRPIKLRLKGIDAPERCQPWGLQSQAALSAKVLGQRVRWQTSGRDDFDRSLGNVWLAGEDVSAWLVSQGHAWSYSYRRSAGFYAAQEDAAKQARRGLFADPRALPPRQFRKLHGPCP